LPRARSRADRDACVVVDGARRVDDRTTTSPTLPGAGHVIGLDAIAFARLARLARLARPPGIAGLGAKHAARIESERPGRPLKTFDDIGDARQVAR
jgi:hypothetical protein